MARYLVDEGELDLAEARRLFRALLTWAAIQSDRFVILIQPDIYENPEDATQLSALGQITERASGPDDRFSRVLSKLFGKPTKVIQVEGKPDERFIRELTRKGAPDRAIAGDVCPVEDLMIFSGERLLYASYEYGRDHILDLTSEELNDLHQTLRQSSFDSTHIIPAPPTIVDRQ